MKSHARHYGYHSLDDLPTLQDPKIQTKSPISVKKISTTTTK
jgi:hypothetical protein